MLQCYLEANLNSFLTYGYGLAANVNSRKHFFQLLQYTRTFRHTFPTLINLTNIMAIYQGIPSEILTEL